MLKNVRKYGLINTLISTFCSPSQCPGVTKSLFRESPLDRAALLGIHGPIEMGGMPESFIEPVPYYHWSSPIVSVRIKHINLWSGPVHLRAPSDEVRCGHEGGTCREDRYNRFSVSRQGSSTIQIVPNQGSIWMHSRPL